VHKLANGSAADFSMTDWLI